MGENRYLLVVMVGKRAKQLIAGAKPLIETKSKNPVAIALKEIELGKEWNPGNPDSLHLLVWIAVPCSPSFLTFSQRGAGLFKGRWLPISKISLVLLSKLKSAN